QAQHVIGAVRTLYSVEPAGRGGDQLITTCHVLVLREEGLVLSQLEHAGGLSAPAKRVSLSQLDLCKLGEIDSLANMSAKFFLGHRLRRLRRDHELSQTDMAARLAISPSYLNHLERNQRPVTAGMLLKLAELYDIDMRAFASSGGTRTGPDELAEIFSDALLTALGVPRYELTELAHNAPAVADAIARLYAAL